MGSSSFSISREELTKWAKNVITFFAPLFVLIYYPYITANMQVDGISFSDFIPNNFILGSFTLFITNALYDFLRKLVPDTTSGVKAPQIVTQEVTERTVILPQPDGTSTTL